MFESLRNLFSPRTRAQAYVTGLAVTSVASAVLLTKLDVLMQSTDRHTYRVGPADYIDNAKWGAILWTFGYGLNMLKNMFTGNQPAPEHRAAHQHRM